MTPPKSKASASAKAARSEHGDVTTLLLAWRAGDQAALDRIIPVVHGELRKVAKRHMAGEGKAHTLQASALINEAYLRLVDVRQMNWRERGANCRGYRRQSLDLQHRERHSGGAAGDREEFEFHAG